LNSTLRYKRQNVACEITLIQLYRSYKTSFNSGSQMLRFAVTSTIYIKALIFIVHCALAIVLEIWHSNLFSVWVWFLLQGIQKMADGKSHKETWLNCTIRPFARLYFDDISSMQLLPAKGSSLFLSKPFMKIW